MKRYVRSSFNDELKSIKEAKKQLNNYDIEKVAFVRDCYNDVLDDLSSHYEDESGETSVHTSEIKRDWLSEAIEEDLMTEDEFETIYQLLEIAGTEDAIAHS